MRDRLGAIAGWWAMGGGALLLAIIAVTLTNVGAFALNRLARPFGGAVGGLPGYEDFVQLAVGAAALMFLPWCQHRRGHVAADLVGAALPLAARRALDRLWLVAAALVAGFLAVMMARGMLESRADGALTPVLGWPEWPFLAPGVASLVLWALVALAQLGAPDAEAEAGHG